MCLRSAQGHHGAQSFHSFILLLAVLSSPPCIIIFSVLYLSSVFYPLLVCDPCQLPILSSPPCSSISFPLFSYISFPSLLFSLCYFSSLLVSWQWMKVAYIFIIFLQWWKVAYIFPASSNIVLGFPVASWELAFIYMLKFQIPFC